MIYPLIDSRIVAQMFAMKREIVPPRDKANGPILVPGVAYGSILRDSSGQWRMWYLSDPYYCEYYATSDDGLNWRLPHLELVTDEVRDQLTGPNAFMTKNQKDDEGRWLVGLRGPEGFCVLDSEMTPHPAATSRFTALYLARFEGSTDTIPGLCIAHSDDGLHWRADESNPVIHGWHDTNNMFFYDQRIGRYVLYGRPDAFVSHVTKANRLIGRCESEDLIHWTPFRTVLDCDERDAPAFDMVDEAALRDGRAAEDARRRARVWAEVTEGAVTDEERPLIRGRSRQWYGMTVFPYGGLYLGQALLYDVETGYMWIELLHSYDGLDWRREPLREPWVDVRPGRWDFPQLRVAGSPPVEVGDELWTYYSSMNATHHGVVPEGAPEHRTAIGIAAVDRDRWVAYTADQQEGELLTEAIERPHAITLNARTQADGCLRVEITDAAGKAVPRFSIADCHPITGDAFEHRPVWNDSASLSAVEPTQIRLRLTARRASIYAIGCHPEP